MILVFLLLLHAEKINEMKRLSVNLKDKKSILKLIYNVALYGFAIAGFLIIGAWAFYQLGFTKNSGSIDKNNRYLAEVSKIEVEKGNNEVIDEKEISESFIRLAAISRYYPKNAKLILDAVSNSQGFGNLPQLITATEVSLQDEKEYFDFIAKSKSLIGGMDAKAKMENAIEWMNTQEWEALKVAILKDKHLIDSAAEITGVESRMIVSCLVGEQIRLFNSKREMFKKYLGPVKVLSVQSQFSLGVNGIKDFTAMEVESNLKNPQSPFYMGKEYENILNFKTQNIEEERINRLVDYKNHFYSYIYTGCILHQTKKQWERARYDISNRPEILFTLFNIGFAQSKPSPNPECGGSHITVDDKVYTFGAIGFDFYYSGELAREFPYREKRFKS